MGKYHNDQPIDGGQEEPDLLNRTNFSNHLSSILLLDSEDDCLTVSLEGEWGYGKTSVINLVKTSLKNKEQSPIIIEYNPWLAGKPESLIQDFLLQFSSQLNIRDNSEDALKAAKELIAYSSLFSAAKLIPGAEPWASIIEKVFSKFGKATKKIAELKKLDLLGKKNKVISAIKKIKKPIIVIIDDIDRLTPSETFQVLRLVKAVADFSGTSFLLAFDAKYLSSVLNKNNIENSTEYINKVIQLRVPLPLISDRSMNELANLEFERLSDKNLTGHFESDQERLSWLYHNHFKYIIKNPRDLKRFFNHLRFVYEQVEGEVCFADLFALSIIATKASETYEHIKKTPEAYIGCRFNNDGLLMGKPKEIVSSLADDRKESLKGFSKSEVNLINGLLGDIFPLIDSGDFSHYGASNDDAAGRVSALQRLYVALHYTTPTNYISDKEIIDFIKGNVNRKDFLIDVFANDSNERFFEMMTHYSSECKENSFDILTNIYDANLSSNQLKASLEENIGFMTNDPFRKMVWLTNKVITDNNKKDELIKRILSRYQNSAISADLLRKVRKQEAENQWVTKEQLIELELLFQNSAIEALNKKTFNSNHLESHIFYELQRSSPERTKKLMSEIIDTENGIIRIAEIIGNSGSDSSNGPYVEIKDKHFSDVIDMKLLKEKAMELIETDLPVNIKAIIKSIVDGEKYYLRDGMMDDQW
ncbi:KAP family P-loop NTPase fold protein [Photobacterium indicum]|uniref:AAA family ATPase n=1 Tax=Photobacterium indicum TaxID=81447 RepID=A0A2T3L2S9_9GAMM|nr:P-loop NTPase fold protein [Photobacterium indicum]PSV43185.1 AAA family ATPase [Photobacterium indicum]